MANGAFPLFPLPVVLFPGTAIPLHIFEARYRSMLDHVLEGDRRFGLLYHDADLSGPFSAEPGRVGTVAEVRKHQPLSDGRSLILARGVKRFRIVEEVGEGRPFHRAVVGSYVDDPPGDPAALVARRSRSLALFERVLQGLPHVPEALPSFKVERELSFRLAAVARMDTFWQQELLELKDEAARLDRLDPVFRFGIDKRWEGGKAEA